MKYSVPKKEVGLLPKCKSGELSASLQPANLVDDVRYSEAHLNGAAHSSDTDAFQRYSCKSVANVA